jgi:NitT/TauT family transport system ATP-binding protein
VTEPLIEIEGLRMTFDTPTGPREVLDGLDFSVLPGEVVCVVGPSGVGKSTLMRCMGGLQVATSGSVRFAGVEVSEPPARLGYVFQDYSRSLLPWMRIVENVALPLRAAGVGRAERRERALALLAQIGLEQAALQYPWQLSGGMQQRIALARALISEPEGLLMDEPFASVDAQTRFELEDLTLAVRRRIGVSVVLVTHDIDEAVYLGDRVVVIAGSPATIIDIFEVPFGPERDQVTTRAQPRFAELRSQVLQEIRQGFGGRTRARVEPAR